RTPSLVYALLFSSIAVMGPLSPLAFSARGLSAGLVAALATLATLVRVLLPMFTGREADRRGRRGLLVGLGFAGSAAAFGLALFPSTPAAFVLFPFYVAMAAGQVPLADVLAHEQLAERAARFAWVRVWGSLGFALAMLGAGALELPSQPELHFLVGGLLQLAAAGAALGFPDDRPAAAASRPSLSAAWSTAGALGLRAFLIAGVVHYIGFGIYDAYFALRLEALGYGTGFVGVAIAVGVVAEVGMMLVAPRLVQRAGVDGAKRLALAGAAAAWLRWMVIASTDQGSLLLVVQPLHALGFGLWYLAVVSHIQGLAPSHLKASLQSLATAGSALGALVGTSLGGLLVARWGLGPSFVLAAVTSSLAVTLYALVVLRPRGLATVAASR
ncbi:MAG: MFS transporter, partial [Myxococcota bacterium]